MKTLSSDLRDRASTDISKGAVTKTYKGHREEILQLLNNALATEIVCVLRYKHDAEMARGIHAQFVAKEFSEHANEEFQHVDKLAKRISQLNGKPNFNPEGLLARSSTEYIECDDLMDMIGENLIAERTVIETYSTAIRHIGDKDSTTRRLLEDILKDEEEHADELSRLLEKVNTEAYEKVAV